MKITQDLEEGKRGVFPMKSVTLRKIRRRVILTSTQENH